MIHILNVAPSDKVMFLKSQSLYERKIYSKKSLHDLLIANDDEFVKFKSQIASLMSEPFWETNQKHDSDKQYCWNGECITSSSIAETCERGQTCVSFAESRFNISPLEIIVDNNDTVNVENFFSLGEWLEWNGNNRFISKDRQCKLFFKNSKLNFDNLGKNFGFDSINPSLHKKFFDSFKQFAKMSWEEIYASDGMQYKSYTPPGKKDWFDNSKFSNKKIYKFRIDQKMRCFGYREREVFYVIRFESDHSISDWG